MPRNFEEYVHPRDDAERARLESLVREEYDRSHPGDSFDDMKLRAPFSREDRGLYRDWLTLAAARAAELSAAAAGDRHSNGHGDADGLSRLLRQGAHRHAA